QERGGRVERHAGARGDGHAVGGGDADGGRAAHHHVLDGARHLVDGAAVDPDLALGQKALIEQREHAGLVVEAKRREHLVEVDDVDCAHERSLFRISFTISGLALPCVAFMTLPTKKPRIFGLPPLYCATCFGLASTTSRQTRSMAPASLTWVRPSASTMARGARPSARIFS